MTPELLERIRQWADAQAVGEPPFLVPDHIAPYLLRWEPQAAIADDHVYIHRITASEPQDAMHDHPWPNASLILSGRYIEHTPTQAFIREPGALIVREPEDAHRMELNPGETCLTLFVTGDMVRHLCEGNLEELGIPV